MTECEIGKIVVRAPRLRCICVYMPLWCVEWWACKQTQRLRYQWSLFLWVQFWQVWVVYLDFRYQMKPTTLPYNHMCIPSVWLCSNSFAESINSRESTCSHKYTTHCPAGIKSLFCFSQTQTRIFFFFATWLYFSASLTLTHTAPAFPCFVPGQLRFRSQTQILLRVIQSSSTQGPPEGRGYTTTSTKMSLAHRTQAYTNIHSLLLHPCSLYQRIWTVSPLSIFLPWEQPST